MISLIQINNIFVVCILICYSTIIQSLNFATFLTNKNGNNNVQTMKVELLSLSRKVNRGLTESPEDRTKILELFDKIEKCNKKNETLANNDLNAVWNLEYTTSDSILDRKGAPKVAIYHHHLKGPILQLIDGKNLKAENKEIRKYFNTFDVPVKVTAELTPVTPSRVDVQFKVFTIGPISFPAPNSFQSWLDVTYLDKDLRLSRGSRGNIFVLSRYSDLPFSK